MGSASICMKKVCGHWRIHSLQLAKIWPERTSVDGFCFSCTASCQGIRLRKSQDGQ